MFVVLFFAACCESGTGKRCDGSWPRFPLYLEAIAWVSNLKQKMVCGSVMMVGRMQYFDFSHRAMRPGVHYVEVDTGPRMCEDIARKVSGQVFPSCH